VDDDKDEEDVDEDEDADEVAFALGKALLSSFSPQREIRACQKRRRRKTSRIGAKCKGVAGEKESAQ